MAVLSVWMVGSSLSAYPHSLAYFNELAGGPTRGHHHFLGSSLHWGEDLWLLKRWKDRHCPDQPLWLGYRTAVHPGWLGLDFRPLPPGPRSHRIREEASDQQFGPQPGWYAVSVSVLYGEKTVTWKNERRMIEMDPMEYRYLRQLNPVDRVGYSILIYHLSMAEANQLRRQYGYRNEETLP